jgi:hypothetical protein
MRQPPDDGLRPLLIRLIPSVLGSPVHWVALESALTESGIPDAVLTWRGRTTWVECKSTSGWALGTLTEFQVGFALTLARSGGRQVIATRRRSPGGPRSPPCDELWLHDGGHAPALRAGGLRAAPALLVEGGQWDLGLAGRVLVGA